MRLFVGLHLRGVPRSLAILVGAAVAVVAAGPPSAVAQPAAPLRWDGQFELVSGIHRQYDPVTPGNGPSRVSQQAISADGRWVMYSTDATNLGFQGSAVYRLDRLTGQAYPITGGVAGLGMSADANHIVWNDCWGGIPGANCQIFAIDARTWSYSWLNAGLDGTISPGDSQGAVLSSNGRYAVFASDVQPLTGDPLWGRHIIWRDRDPDGNGVYDEPGSVLLETISAGPGGFGDGESATPQVSDDGRFVAFRSLASNLVPGDVNGTWDVFLRDRLTGETRRLSSRPGNDPSPFPIDEPHLSMSADGRYVAFASADPMLVVLPYGDVNGARDVYVYDREAGALSRIEVGRIGNVVVAGDGATSWPTLSADGRYLVLQSAAGNVPAPAPPAGSTQVYVADRTTGALTRVSVRPDGSSPDASSTQPTISADGSVVLFQSAATNYVDGVGSGPEQIYAAVYLETDPAEVRIPAGGGQSTVAVRSQLYTRWWPAWDPEVTWLSYYSNSGVSYGSLTFSVYEPNPGGERSVAVRVGARTVTVVQEAGLSLTSVSPAQGPAAGGTVVTLHGSGFEAGATVWFGGQPIAVQAVTPTAITVTTPFWSSPERTVSVMVQNLDGRWAMLDAAFTFVGDVTPPLVSGTPTGTLGLNGWFVSNVGITWTLSDPDSAITSTNCSNNSTYTLDTAGQTISCFAISGGGTTWGSVTFKKDATPPVVTVTSPQAGRLYDLGAVVNSAFTCTDARSGVAACGVAAPPGAPIDTATPGLKTFAATGTDVAGNLKTVNVDYAVASGVCSAPPAGLASWARLENALADTANPANTLSTIFLPSVTYVAGEVGQAMSFPSRTSGYLMVNHQGRLTFANRTSVALWVNPSMLGSPSTLVFQQSQYWLDLSSSGSVQVTLKTPPLPPGGWTTISAGSNGSLPRNAWSHVVMTFDAGELRLYINGKLDNWWQMPVASLMQTNPTLPIEIGASGPSSGLFVGALDEVQFYDRALDAAAVAGLYLSGTRGICPPVATTLEAPTVTTTYLAGTFESTAILRDAGGAPVAGQTIAMREIYGGRTASLVTDATGTVRWTVPFTLPAGNYPTAIQATFAGNPSFVGSSATGVVTVQKVTPVITWPAPAPITYGTALSGTQLNATVNVAGTKTYTPAAGTVLGAGLQTLQVSFVPTSQQNYANASATVTLEVRKALPTVTVTGGTFLYDGQPHPATATVTGVGGANLGAATFTYNGSPETPVAAGVYAVVATFAGDANHESRSATGTVTIDPYTPVVAVTGGTFTYDAQPHAASATVTGVGTEVPPGAVTVTYNGSTTTPVDAGTYAVTASVAAAGNYRTASATGTLTILKAPATLSLQATTVTFDGLPHPAIATATGANGASLSPVTITYDGASTVPLNGGAYAVEATFAGDTNHLPASATATLVITKAVPVLAWTAPAPITYGTALSAAQLNATSSVAGTFAYLPEAGAMLAAGPVHSLTATFTPAEPRNYEGGTVSTAIAVLQATPVVTVTGGAFTYDGQPHPAIASATGAGGTPLTPVTVTYNGASAAPVGAGSYEVVATFAGDANHATASATATISGIL